MKVARWGNSLAIRIPHSVAEEAQLREGTEVELTVEDGVVAIRPRRPKLRELEALVAAITPDNRHDETEWGEREGREAW